MRARFQDAETRRRLDVETMEMLALRGGAEKILLVDPRPALNGRTLAQVKAARPTLDFDGVFTNPKWTTDQFVEAVYKDLSKAAAPARAGSN